MILIKDCSDSYFRVDDKDYLICNETIVANYANATKINATFVKLESCSALKDIAVCYLNHPNEGLIEVKKIQ